MPSLIWRISLCSVLVYCLLYCPVIALLVTTVHYSNLLSHTVQPHCHHPLHSTSSVHPPSSILYSMITSFEILLPLLILNPYTHHHSLSLSQFFSFFPFIIVSHSSILLQSSLSPHLSFIKDSSMTISPLSMPLRFLSQILILTYYIIQGWAIERLYNIINWENSGFARNCGNIENRNLNTDVLYKKMYHHVYRKYVKKELMILSLSDSGTSASNCCSFAS